MVLVENGAKDFIASISGIEESLWEKKSVIVEGFLESLLYSPFGNLVDLHLDIEWAELGESDIYNFFTFWGQGLKKTDFYYAESPDVLIEFFNYSFKRGWIELEKLNGWSSICIEEGNRVRLEKLEVALVETYSKKRFNKPVFSNVVSFNQFKKPQIKLAGAMELVGCEDDHAIFRSHYGQEVGPIQVDKKVLSLLEDGDIVNLSIGKFGPDWKILDFTGLKQAFEELN